MPVSRMKTASRLLLAGLSAATALVAAAKPFGRNVAPDGTGRIFYEITRVEPGNHTPENVRQ